MKVKFLEITVICALFVLFMPVIANAATSGNCGADGNKLSFNVTKNQ